MAILDTLLKQLGTEKYDITVLSKNPSKVIHVLQLREYISFIKSTKIFSILKAIIKTDKVMIGGGGLFFDYSFFDTIFLIGKSQLMVWVIITIWAGLWRKEVEWIGLGIGPLTKFGKILVKFASFFVNKVIVRDIASHSILKEELGIRKTQKASDIVYLRKSPEQVQTLHKMKATKPGERKLLLTFKQGQLPFETYASVVDQIKNDFPDYTLTYFSTNPKRDNELHIKLAKETNSLFIDTSSFTIEQFYGLFTFADIVISMRMHALLIGYQEGVLGIGISSEASEYAGPDDTNKVISLQKELYGNDLFIRRLRYKKVKELLYTITGDAETTRVESEENYEKQYSLAGNSYSF